MNKLKTLALCALLIFVFSTFVIADDDPPPPPICTDGQVPVGGKCVYPRIQLPEASEKDFIEFINDLFNLFF